MSLVPFLPHTLEAIHKLCKKTRENGASSFHKLKLFASVLKYNSNFAIPKIIKQKVSFGCLHRPGGDGAGGGVTKCLRLCKRREKGSKQNTVYVVCA